MSPRNKILAAPQLGHLRIFTHAMPMPVHVLYSLHFSVFLWTTYRVIYVAVKVLKKDKLQDLTRFDLVQKNLNDFKREAKLMAQLYHQNVLSANIYLYLWLFLNDYFRAISITLGNRGNSSPPHIDLSLHQQKPGYGSILFLHYLNRSNSLLSNCIHKIF